MYMEAEGFSVSRLLLCGNSSSGQLLKHLYRLTCDHGWLGSAAWPNGGVHMETPMQMHTMGPMCKYISLFL